MPRREGSAPCPPPQARTRPSLRAATVRERDAPMPRPTNAILDAESIPPASRISVSAEPSTLRRPTHAFLHGNLPPPRIQSLLVGLVRPLVFHFLHPVSLTLGVFAFHLVPLLLGHAMVASHTLLGLFGLESLVLPTGFHTSHPLVVASTVHGLHVLDAIHRGILTLPIQFLLLFFVFFRVPFFLGGPVQSWHIHDPTPVLGQHTRLPTPATFGMGWESAEPGHDGPVAAGQSGRGDDGNSRGSERVLGPNAWLGTGYRPTGSILGLSQSVPGSGAVWAVWVVGVSSWLPAAHVSVSQSLPCV